MGGVLWSEEELFRKVAAKYGVPVQEAATPGGDQTVPAHESAASTGAAASTGILPAGEDAKEGAGEHEAATLHEGAGDPPRQDLEGAVDRIY